MIRSKDPVLIKSLASSILPYDPPKIGKADFFSSSVRILYQKIQIQTLSNPLTALFPLPIPVIPTTITTHPIIT
jgi:hypothetical protein